MSTLLPKFHPLVWIAFTAFYILCLLEGSEPNPDIQHALLPAIALGVAAASGIAGSIAQSKRQKEAIEAQKKVEAKRRKDIKSVLGPEAKRAKERLAKGKYGLSQARQREGVEEIQRATEAQAKGERAQLERGEEGAYGPGRKDALKRAMAGRQASAVAQGRLGTARGSDQLGAQQRGADVATRQHYGATLGGLQSAVPAMQHGTPGVWEQMAGVATQGLTAGATMGMFSGGGAKTPETAPGKTSDSVVTDPLAMGK